MNEFRMFVKLQKAYQGEDQNWYVQGIASGTLEDRDGERMNKSVLENFLSHLPLPLTDSHPKKGSVMGYIGTVVSGKILEDGNSSLFIEAMLDKDNPATPYLVKQMQKGKKFAFSIEGLIKKAVTVWSDKLNKFITEYVDVVPEAVSITSEPAYIGSFADVLAKSVSKGLSQNETTVNNEDITNLNSDNTMKKTTTTETEQKVPEAVKPVQPVEEVKEVPVENTEAEVKLPETKVEEPVKDEPAKVEPEVAEPKAEEVVKSATVQKDYAPDDEMGELKEAVVNAVEQTIADQAEQVEDENRQDTIMEVLQNLCMKVDALSSLCQNSMDMAMAMQGDMEKTTKALSDNEKVLKSVHEEMEVIKDLPLQKRSRIVSKSYEERQNPEAETAKPFVNAVKKFIDQD